ncbi:peptidoglycan-binding protein LysM [Amylibacter ulvae]|uniref:Peptidoglycan-binding protein LysM n=1 Tax=Paramylibacter ulvae TaxID=1651968 RepID=A0ABQ3D3B8_9RHOB|nr:Ig-like domain-containing protein [Amylibacter ulvae]GHA53742.1 peptidoglycan-binding protein LysM [Amylibacter ulvae]
MNDEINTVSNKGKYGVLIAAVILLAVIVWIAQSFIPDSAVQVADTSTAVEKEPETTVSVEPSVEPTPLTFDVVRVDETGGAVIAGRGEPSSTITVTGNGQELGQAEVGADGNFVALLDVPTGDEPTTLRLKSEQDGATSDDSFLVMPIAPETNATPMIVGTQDGQVITTPSHQVDQSQSPSVVSEITLDTIDYAATGDVVFSGRGVADNSVRVYVNNEPQEIGQIDNGRWSVALPDVDEGIYTVRIDSISETGAVTSRIESPFKREIPDGDTLRDSVTIQPGFTLWALAKQKYGAGTRFVQIYDANRDTIKDPDLIYPGQVFTLPN